MPTRTRSPSCLAHSCSRVYFRSLGTLAIFSPCRRSALAGPRRSTFGLSAWLFHPGRIEGRADDPGRLALTADLDLERGADSGQGRLDVGDPDVPVDRRAVRARGDDADCAAVFLHGVAVARDGLVDHLDADQAAPYALGADFLERLAPDELAFGRLDDPPEPRFERIRRLVDVVAVEGVLHLEPQRVARPEPDQAGSVGAAGGQERFPEPHGLVGGRVELEAVLAGVTRPRDHGRHLADVAAREAVVPDGRHVAVGEAADERLGLRPLHRDEPGALGRVAPARVLDVRRRLRHVGPVFVNVTRVDCDHVALVAHAVDREVVDDRAVRIAEDRILDLADLESRHVVGGQVLERREGAGALDLEFAHVAHVEEADGAAGRTVLLDDAGVLHRHLPAAERHHARAGRDVLVIERRALERVRHAFGSQSRSGLTWQPARSRASRTVRTIFCAPGVSPWQQIVWTEMSISTPSIVRTLPSMAIFTAWAAARSGSVMSEPGSLRETSVRSTLYARSAKPSEATRTPILRAVRSYFPDASAMRIRSRPDSRADSATAVASGSALPLTGHR